MTEWREIPGYPSYKVSEDGQILSLFTGKLKTLYTGRSCMEVGLHHNITKKVHSLVALAFIGPPTGPVIRHLDGNFTNNHFSNLVYGTQAENIADAYRHGTLPWKRTPLTHCSRGHEFTPDNTWEDPNGRPRCRACWKAYNQTQMERRARQEAGIDPVSKKCSRDSCGSPMYARELCRSHYRSVRHAAGHNA